MDYKEQLEHTYAQEMEKLKSNKPNLMLVGGSGVGKSSLINKIFGQKAAASGTGLPVTDIIELYSSPDSFINIFDTMGYETKYENASAEEANKFETLVLGEVKKRKTGILKDQIHVIWYCISITNHRVFDYDAKNIKELYETRTPLFIVFTKCDEDSEDAEGKGVTAGAFKKALQEYGLGHVRCFETAAEGELSFELDALLEKSRNALSDENLRKAFDVAQLHNLPMKINQAHKIIHAAAALAATAAATPIPCADAIAINGIQVTMAMSLASLYGFDNFGEAAKSLLQTQLLSLLGKQLASSLTKLIPGIGSAINASVAFSLTEALGWALAKVYEGVLEEYLKTGKEPVWVEIFTSEIILAMVTESIKSACSTCKSSTKGNSNKNSGYSRKRG